ncbi:hypothetical protein RBH26_10315 [Natronolimnohabitans sp. A-GB9]|uniref:hypothetical protein n=1 Tax=Natronolimnohabitans sp. A-GB9 TaxID=3069757 RepID=UPI0027B24C66|nr:hypothetical protein [Natronolimnohabitans sp. A-GB9]MDQ2050877.1 hypothetical protein [Natronolimnohabitans sp. A-GB9]
MDDHPRLTEIDDEKADALADIALESEYVTRLEAYLEAEYGETVPTDTVRAFERDDGVRAVSFEAESEPATTERPPVAITVHLEEKSVVQATAERRGDDVDGTVELIFPTETAPRPEAAVRDIFRPEGQSVDVTVDESDEITRYTIAGDGSGGT